MQPRMLPTACGLAAVHLVTVVMTFLVAYGYGMSRFDDGTPGPVESLVVDALDLAVLVLAFPGAVLWTPWMSRNLPDVAEWALLAANSLLWGFAGAWVLARVLRRRAPRRVSSEQ